MVLGGEELEVDQVEAVSVDQRELEEVVDQVEVVTVE